MSRPFRDIDGGAVTPHGSVVCIGAFDGLHLGHQALVRHAVERGRARALPVVALSFEPLPREFFSAASRPSRLLSARTKLEGLCALGVDRVGLLRFDQRLSAMPADDFIGQVLSTRLAAREVWVGPDFRFGRGRAGDLTLLRHAGNRHGFAAGSIELVDIGGVRVSSTRIRQALAAGNLADAAVLLGRPYTIANRVVRGRQLGRTLGYPTANLRLPRGDAPLSGIFATWVHGIGPRPLASVSSLGTRPTVGGVEPLLETHLFDFDADIYGRRIEVEFVARLRDELRFDGLEPMIAQMHHDAALARRVLASPPPLLKTA